MTAQELLPISAIVLSSIAVVARRFNYGVIVSAPGQMAILAPATKLPTGPLGQR